VFVMVAGCAGAKEASVNDGSRSAAADIEAAYRLQVDSHPAATRQPAKVCSI
jgi:hypothetical protein